MKVLLLGANGFLGAAVGRALSIHHDVYAGTIDAVAGDHMVYIDLLEKDTIVEALKTVQPDAIVNCAGIVENSEKAQLNVTFTTNLLEAALNSGLTFKRIIVTGSAGEYGIVKPEELPVSEDVPLRADSRYGRSKIDEEQVALGYRTEHGLPVVVARVFNPVGAGMNPRMLIPGIVRQIREIEAGDKHSIELSRLDAQRDYISIQDVASAYSALVDGDLEHTVYNVGSGESTSNAALIDLVLKNSKLGSKPKLVETADKSEPLFANQADIGRLKALGWSPQHSIAETVKEIFDAE